MWTSEQLYYQEAINNLKYPKPKCRVTTCSRKVEPFNDGLCFVCGQDKSKEKLKITLTTETGII